MEPQRGVDVVADAVFVVSIVSAGRGGRSDALLVGIATVTVVPAREVLIYSGGWCASRSYTLFHAALSTRFRSQGDPMHLYH